MDKRILVINPGSTSTKVALFDGATPLWQETLRYSPEELKDFNWIMEQVDFRRASVEKILQEKDVALTSLDAICARGGMVPACPSGAFRVDQQMVDYMYGIVQGAHASNLGCVVAYQMASPLHIPAFVYDPVTVDEMLPEARITGMPELPRRMVGHALNTRAMAIRCAEEVLHKPLKDCRLIVLHLGGGASVRLFVGGRMVDNVRDDELLFAPERCGGLDAEGLVHLCFSGKYTEKELMKLVRGKGGLLAHLGTNDAMEVERRIATGDEKARMVYDAMLYTASKSIGALAAAAEGRIDRIILTGGIAHSSYVTDYIARKVQFIAPIEVMAGEFEMEALAAGACRVLFGEETARNFAELLH
ncbi:MAG: butyrate kinase [Clostridiales bacterium]|nr:butyrate kinase [Clostridiales bacterium]